MNKKTISIFIQHANAAIATVFGLITIGVGGATLLGFSDPGYVIFLPLLIFNTAMGFAYTATGYLIWRKLQKGIKAAKFIFLINLLVLILIAIAYWLEVSVAIDSLKAMSFRTVIWLIIYAGLAGIHAFAKSK
jgi:divalent metal cation (Fe/Co/Zn/Cd) transporter